MPIFNGTVTLDVKGKKFQPPQALQKIGPVAPVLIGCPEVVNKKLAKEGKEAIASVERIALVDTGCTTTSVDRQVIEKLGLPPISTTTLSHASGSTETTVHAARLLFPTMPGAPQWNGRVICCDLSGHPFRVLIGRDILAGMVLICNGPAGLFTLAY